MIDTVKLLRNKQSQLGIGKDQDFAKLLGISHPYLSLLYSGKRGPGAKLVLHMVELWPDVFSGVEENGERHSEGDEYHGGADDGRAGDLDGSRVVGDPCPARPVG